MKPTPPKLISLSQRISLWFLRVPATPLVEARRRLLESGQDVAVSDLCSHHLSGGDVGEVAAALVEAKQLQVPLDFRRACALDLAAGRHDPARRPRQLVREAAAAREVFFESVGPMEIGTPAKFTWRPRLRALLKLDLANYLEGAGEDLIAVRLKLALRTLYDRAVNAPAADQALAHWLSEGERLPGLAEGTRHTLLSLKRVL